MAKASAQIASVEHFLRCRGGWRGTVGVGRSTGGAAAIAGGAAGSRVLLDGGGPARKSSGFAVWRCCAGLKACAVCSDIGGGACVLPCVPVVPFHREAGERPGRDWQTRLKR
jgi:hypothetical protein